MLFSHLNMCSHYLPTYAYTISVETIEKAIAQNPIFSSIGSGPSRCFSNAPGVYAQHVEAISNTNVCRDRNAGTGLRGGKLYPRHFTHQCMQGQDCKAASSIQGTSLTAIWMHLALSAPHTSLYAPQAVCCASCTFVHGVKPS